MISARSVTAACLFVCVARLLTSALSGAPVHGTVFDDRNGNGVRDPGEPGIAAVNVSNGAEVTVSGDDGAYAIEARADSFVFVIKPRGWAVLLSPQNLPRYFHRVSSADSASASVDFGLHRHDEPDAFRALLFTDTQPSSSQDVGYLGRTIASRVGADGPFAFSVTLGDVVNDRLDLYPEVVTTMAQIGVPLYHVNGNHDLTLNAPDDVHSAAGFEAFFGPSTYAFNYGRVLFVALNDVRYLGGPRYVGGLREDQFTFLENVLKHAPADQPVVLMMHIPWFFPNPSNLPTFRLADRDRLFALLKDRPNNLLLSGHTHYQRHVFYGAADGWKGAQPLHEYNVAAACGGFWGGAPDQQGIPLATMWDGTPHGYGILTVNGSELRVEYRAARFPAEHQIGLHAPVTAKPKTGYISFYANVFNGHDGWKVEARVDDRDWKPITRVLGWDPAYAKLYLAQDELPQPLAPPRLPDPEICYHLWRGYLPADLALGDHRIEVRATDPYGQTFTESRSVKIVEPK